MATWHRQFQTIIGRQQGGNIQADDEDFLMDSKLQTCVPSPMQVSRMHRTHTKRSARLLLCPPKTSFRTSVRLRGLTFGAKRGVRRLQLPGDEGGSRAQATVETAVVRDSRQLRLLQQDHGHP
jgi:hypothetical protein